MNTEPILVLRDDVLILPVRELGDEVRERLDGDEEDYAISRPLSRRPSTLVDPETAALLERFRQPRSLVEAVILFARPRGLDCEALLEGVWPAVHELTGKGYLVDTRSNGEPGAVKATLMAGDRIGEATVLRLVQLLEDTELHQVRLPSGRYGALKILRDAEQKQLSSLRREQEALSRLAGLEITPELLAAGQADGRDYLILEWCRGTHPTAVASEIRQEGTLGRQRLVGLLEAVARAFGNLHEAGVLHGDIHPRNLLVDGADRVRLLDLGAARPVETSDRAPGGRPGVPFFFEPELARAALAGEPLPPVSPAGEQYAVAALLWLLATGARYLDFSLEHDRLLEQVSHQEPISFTERGVAAWPRLEAVLRRALAKQAKERYASLTDLADALAEVAPPVTSATRDTTTAPSELERVGADWLRRVRLGQEWCEKPVTTAPHASLFFGSAGIGYGLYRVAGRLRDAELFAAADLWACRAAASHRSETAFLNPEIDVSAETVSVASPFHSLAGVEVVQAMIARAQGNWTDFEGHARSFAGLCAARSGGTDLTMGLSGTLLATSLLLDAVGTMSQPLRQLLLALGRAVRDEVWELLDREPEIARSSIRMLGLAHGWAGNLYATLVWSRLSGDEIPPILSSRLEELRALAIPSNRGLQWPWQVPASDHEPVRTMPGWCNGSAGHLLLWTTAHQLLAQPQYLEMAIAAAWDVWESPEQAGSLCCGLAGRSWALLTLFRHTGESRWLDRARVLGERAITGIFEPDYSHSIYKGEMGLAVLAADLMHPEESAMPFIEVEGWS